MTWHYIVRLNKFKEQQQQKSEVNKVKLRERPAYKRFQLSWDHFIKRYSLSSHSPLFATFIIPAF